MNDEADYDSQAADYDKSRFNDNMGRHLDCMHKKILRDLIDSSSKRFLEAGVGTGRFATWLAKKGFEVVGIDISKEMLKKAREKRKTLDVDMDLILADVHCLPFRKRIFDCCICINTIDHFSDLDGFLKQLKDIVKSEGHFICNFPNLLSPYLPIAMIVNSRKRTLFKGGMVRSKWSTLWEISEMISRNGFGILETKGCFIASPIPWGNTLTNVIRVINFNAENSKLKVFAGSSFVKARLISHPECSK